METDLGHPTAQPEVAEPQAADRAFLVQVGQAEVREQMQAGKGRGSVPVWVPALELELEL